MKPGKGGQIARSAGTYVQLVGREQGYALLRMTSGEMRMVRAECRATIGAVSNPDHQNIVIGKAGRNRWLGRRPSVRGVAMNPIDHPHGGGEGMPWSACPRRHRMAPPRTCLRRRHADGRSVHRDARTEGRRPSQRLRPALPITMFWWSGFDTAPIVARIRRAPCASRPRSCATGHSPVRGRPAAHKCRRARDLAALPGFISTLWTIVPSGMFRSGIALPGLTSTRSPDTTRSPARSRCGARI